MSLPVLHHFTAELQTTHLSAAQPLTAYSAAPADSLLTDIVWLGSGLVSCHDRPVNSYPLRVFASKGYIPTVRGPPLKARRPRAPDPKHLPKTIPDPVNASNTTNRPNANIHTSTISLESIFSLLIFIGQGHISKVALSDWRTIQKKSQERGAKEELKSRQTLRLLAVLKVLYLLTIFETLLLLAVLKVLPLIAVLLKVLYLLAVFETLRLLPVLKVLYLLAVLKASEGP